jgi:eukaryotic-like serine/threonine-protein kinase
MEILKSLKKLFAGKSKDQLPIIDVEKRFDLLGKSGQGSMSKAWRARDRDTGRTVFVKILDKQKTAKFDARFPGLKKPREGAICMELRHENIVKTFEHGLTTEGEQYLVQELIEGVGLNFLIETNSPALKGQRIAILIQLSEALGFLHQSGYLHRDICPRNVMVTNEGQVKLIDFGLTIPFTPEFCKPGNRTGTPDYLAPELIKRVTTDHRVDLFALGVTAYEMFTFKLPWDKGESRQTLESHMNIAGRDPRDYVPELNEQVAQVLIKSIERDPVNRFRSAEEFAEALKELPKQ